MPTTTERTFGIEIEALGLTREGAASALRAAGLDAAVEGYNHTTRSHWKVVTDASVLDGFEVVSPILRGAAGLDDARRAFTALAAAGATINKHCGLHVHFGATDLSANEIATVVRRYARFEAEIDAWMAPSRRGNDNQYCRSLATLLTSAAAAQLASSSASAACRAFSTRYSKVNLRAYEVHGTIEFRQHGGTVDADKGLAWIRFGLAFIEQSRRLATAPASAAIPANTKIAAIIEMMSRLGGASAEDMMTATGWQRHTLRAAISTNSRRMGLTVTTRRAAGTTIYMIAGHAAPAAAPATDHVMAGIDEATATFLRQRAAAFARRATRRAA